MKAVDVRLLLKCFVLGMKDVGRNKLLTLGSFLTYSCIVLSYVSVLRATDPADFTRMGVTFPEMVWYIGVTEFVLFCGSFFHFREIENAINDESIAMALLRPVAFWKVTMPFWLGQAVARFCIQLVPCALILFYLAGGITASLLRLAALCLSLPCAMIVLESLFMATGFLVFWWRDADAFFWIVRKFMYLLGALLWPLSFYPSWLAHFTWATPFPAVLATPAHFVLRSEPSQLLFGFAHQLLFSCLALLGLAALNRAALRHVQRGAGLGAR